MSDIQALIVFNESEQPKAVALVKTFAEAAAGAGGTVSDKWVHGDETNLLVDFPDAESLPRGFQLVVDTVSGRRALAIMTSNQRGFGEMLGTQKLG